MSDEFIYQQLCENVTPIFDKEIGYRMKFMRMALLMDQEQLGERLGVSQQMIAKLELGQTHTSRKPITLSKLYSVFGCAVHHILFGHNKDAYNYNEINHKYWTEKDRRKGNRTAFRPGPKQRRLLRLAAKRRRRHFT